MSQEKTTLEVIAPTVEDAVQKGLAQLNLPQDAVEVEVLDAGSRGLFGLGSRQARIRLTIKSRPEDGCSAFTAAASHQPGTACSRRPVPDRKPLTPMAPMAKDRHRLSQCEANLAEDETR